MSPLRPTLLPSLLLTLACALPPATAAGDIVLTQADGSLLHLAGPAQRIVTLSPHLAEGLYAAGAGERLIATVEYSEFPPPAAEIPRIGDAFRLDVERIAALRPDLVIAWDSGNPRPAVAQLRALGLAVWSVEIRAPEEIAGFIEAAGRAGGLDRQAAAVAQRLRGRLTSLAAHYASARPLDYFYQVDVQPLYTISGQHLISRGLALCGGVNIFADQPGLAFQASRESVIVANPTAIIAPLPSGPNGTADPLAAWRDWPSLTAVRNGALVLLPADEISRATPRFLDALEAACERLDHVRGTASND
ncbi:MAG: cobalamin-binding protein [Lysobacterales bacterium]|nr:MAG: cobalamin-binding protein [Xanthomonadales bacterium]